MTKNKVRRKILGARFAAALAPIVLLAVTLAGCGGGFNNNFYNGDTGLFYGAFQPLGAGNGRTFIELNNGIPVRLGLEFSPDALTFLPNTDPDQVIPFLFSPLPNKTHGTPLTNVLVGYVSNHPATAEPAHFHLVLLIRPLQITTAPFTHERTPVASGEVPEGHILLKDAANPTGVVVPGGGVIYDDPNEPAGKPPETTLGQNYMFFDGHMNGLILGETATFFRRKQSFSKVIKQPQIYPREGYYPTKWGVRYDAANDRHVIEATDFRIAHRVVTPGT
jgi:hypothetical protein